MGNPKVCSVEGCNRRAEARGWCKPHWQRARRDGDPGPARLRRSPGAPPAPCKQEGCVEPSTARGFCAGHYQRWYDGRDLSAPIRKMKPRPPNPPCSIEGCDEPMDSRGWCRRHYLTWWRTGDPGPAKPRRYGQIKVCSAEGCERPHRTKGYCDMHYRRWKRGLDPNSLRFIRQPAERNLTSYAAAHRKVADERGRATDHLCVCGERARQWAYQHDDPEQLTSPLGMPYSMKPEHYAPMCLSCHNLLDYDLDERLRRMREALGLT